MQHSEARRQFLAACSAAGVSAGLFPGLLWAQAQQAPAGRVTEAMIRETAALAGVSLGDIDVRALINTVNRVATRIDQLHASAPGNEAPSPLQFSPRVAGFPIAPPSNLFRPSAPRAGLTRPAVLDDVLFWPLIDLADLVRRRLVTAVELAELSLARLERANARTQLRRHARCAIARWRRRAISIANWPPASTAACCTVSPGA